MEIKMFRFFRSRKEKMQLSRKQSAGAQRAIAHATASNDVAQPSFEQLETRAYMSFTPAVNYTVPTGAGTVLAADVNSDGNNDVIGINPNGSLTTLLGNGDGTFQAPIY